jgi:Domain of unknown function (DUF4388)
MPTDTQAREGILSSTTFPGLVYSILTRKETGVLTLTGDSVEKSIYIQSGRPVFATSNDRDDRLGQIFFKSGAVSLEGLVLALERAAERRRRVGTILVEMELIQPIDLVEGVRAQVRNIVCSLFLWTRGRYRYRPGELPTDEVITLKLSAGDTIIEGIRRVESWERIWEAVGDLDARYRTAPGIEDMSRDLTLSLEEWTLLSHCERPITLRDLCRASPLIDFEICRLVWALTTLGILLRVSPSS